MEFNEGYRDVLRQLPDPPDRERERELARGAQAGDREAASALVTGHLPWVVRHVARYQGQGVEPEDLVQLGAQGLLEALRRFDPDRGVRFLSYARSWVSRECLRAIADQGRPVRLPQNVNRQLMVLSRAREDGEALGPEDRGLLALNRSPARLDEPFGDGDGGRTLYEVMPAHDQPHPDDDFAERELKERLEMALMRLPSRLQFVVRKSFGLDGGQSWTLGEIGAVLGLTTERARQLRDQAIAELGDGPDAGTLQALVV